MDWNRCRFADGAVIYHMGSLVQDLRSSYGAAAPREALALMIVARDRGLAKERDVFVTAAILLCRPSAGSDHTALH